MILTLVTLQSTDIRTCSQRKDWGNVQIQNEMRAQDSYQPAKLHLLWMLGPWIMNQKSMVQTSVDCKHSLILYMTLHLYRHFHDSTPEEKIGLGQSYKDSPSLPIDGPSSPACFYE